MRTYLIKISGIIFEPRIFFLLVAFLLIKLWFAKGLLFGGTEVGIPTYSPEKILNQIIWTWWEALGPGVSFPTISASIPLYILMAALERFGFSAVDIQKILFFIIIYLQGIGTCLLFRQIIPNIGRWQILGGLFYIFNPFMMTYVWHRFIYGNFILSATLPLFLYFYLKLIEKGKFKYIFYFIVTSLLANYMYSAIAPVIAIWLSVLVIYITAIIMNRKKGKQVIRLTFVTILLLIFWFITNLWWIYPLIGIKTQFSVFSLRGHVDTLVSLSEKSTINLVVRGINPFYLFFEEDWGDIYYNPIFQFLSWIPFTLILFGLISKNKITKLWFMIVLFLVGIFVAKGAAKPLGDFTTWVYGHFFYLGVIRNPFEKLGLLVIVPSAILVTIGLKNLWFLYKSIYIRALVIILVIGSGIYVWPMFSDKLFGSTKYPPFFTLPDDYSQVSAFLSKELKEEDGKILHLPITEGDSATYLWKYVYNGVELSSHLFPGSSISRFLYIPYIDQMLGEIARVFHTKNYEFQRQVLSNFGVKYIVLNKNLDWYFRRTDNPLFVEDILDSSVDLTSIKETENLKVYKFIRKTNPVVFSANNISAVSHINNSTINFDFIWNNLMTEDGIFISEVQGQQIPQAITQKEIILPKRIIVSDLSPDRIPEVIIPRPFVKHLPDVFYFPLVIFKEKIELLLTPSFDKPMKMTILTSKRLIEANMLKNNNKKEEFKKSIRRYSNHLDQTLKLLGSLDEAYLDVDILNIFKIMFEEEKNMLQGMSISEGDSDINLLIKNNIEKIGNFRKEKGFEVYYPYSNKEILPNASVHTYQFLTPQRLMTELILSISNPAPFKLDDNRKIKLFLDGVVKEITVKKINNLYWFSLGNVDLKVGIHEISLPIINDQVQIKTLDYSNTNGIVEVKRGSGSLIKITSKDKESWIEYPLTSYAQGKSYLIGFYYQVIKGSTPKVQFWQDSDSLRDKDESKLYWTVPSNSYDFSQKYFALGASVDNPTSVRFDRSTTNPVIRLYLPFWNDCEGKNYRNPNLCKKPQIKKNYNKESQVEIWDFQVKEIFAGRLFLSSDFQDVESKAPLIKFKKISPVEYFVEVENNNPYLYLVLNEGFHSSWKVELNSSTKSEIIDEKNHFLTNGYANGWLINKSGNISLKIKFVPQDNLYTGAIVSSIFYAIALLLFLKETAFRRLTKGHNV